VLRVAQHHDPLQVFSSSRTLPATIVRERAKRRRGKIQRRAVLLLEPCHEVADQGGDLFAALAERRNAYLDDVEPVIEVFANWPTRIAASRSRFVAAIRGRPCG